MKILGKRLYALGVGYAIFASVVTAFHAACWATAAFIVWAPLPFSWGVERFFLALALVPAAAFSLSKEAVECPPSASRSPRNPT